MHELTDRRHIIQEGEVEGQHIFTQLLGGVEQDYIGACRVFGISDKLIFEQLTRLDDEEMVMCWQGIAHPRNSNPFPASFLNFKAQLRLAPILIPGRQTFIDWTMDFMTEAHAVDYMRESMASIMRVALLNLQKFMATGSMPSHSLEMAIRPPASYGISTMPQPVCAPMLLYHQSVTNLAGSQGLRQANATYMPPPMQQTAPIFSSECIDRTVERLEPTVPLLHQAHPATHLLANALHRAQALAAKSAPILRPSSQGMGFAVGEYRRRGSASVAGESPRARTGGSLEELDSAPGWRAQGADSLAISQAGYPAHLVSAGTLLPGGPVGLGVAPPSDQGSLTRAEQPEQQELSLHHADLADGQMLARSRGGSMPSKTSIRALLASQPFSASRSGEANSSSSFRGFQERPPLVPEARTPPRIESGVSLDSLSLSEGGRSFKKNHK